MQFKVKGLRWYIAGLLALVTTINYIDRTSLSVAMADPTFKSQLHLDAWKYARIIVCFQFCYMLVQPISGRVLDWLNLRKGFSLAVIWWSIAKMLHGLANSALSLGIYRGLLGVGEAANFPGVAKTASEWFPPKERTMATGIANIGSGTGALIATPLMAWMLLMWGWRIAFVVTGAIGFFWVVLWLIFYHRPEDHKMITPEELDYIQKGKLELAVEESPHEKGIWKLILKQKNFWAIAIARFLSEPAWQFFSYWIPPYFAAERGMDLKGIALFAWIPFLAADLGSFVGGALSPFFHKFGARVLTARKLAATFAALMMPFALLITKAPSISWALFWFCFAAFGHNCMTATLLTLPADLFPSRTVGTANGLSGFFGYFGGWVFTLAVGLIVTSVGYGPVFVTIAFLDIFGAFFIWTMVREPRTVS